MILWIKEFLVKFRDLSQELFLFHATLIIPLYFKKEIHILNIKKLQNMEL